MADHPSNFRLPFPLVTDAGGSLDGRGGDAEYPPSDEVLLRRAARGHESAFAELLARHEPRLRDFVRYLVGHAGLLEDVMQEVLLQLHRSSSTFANGSTFRTWLYGLAKNVCHHELRRHSRNAKAASVDAEPLRQIRDERLNPLETLTRENRGAAVRRAVGRLPPHLRVVLKLRDWDDLSYAQIAEVLDVPVGTVRSRLHNARVLLAEQLDEWIRERR